MDYLSKTTLGEPSLFLQVRTKCVDAELTCFSFGHLPWRQRRRLQLDVTGDGVSRCTLQYSALRSLLSMFLIYMRIDVRTLSINLTIMPALAKQLA